MNSKKSVTNYYYYYGVTLQNLSIDNPKNVLSIIQSDIRPTFLWSVLVRPTSKSAMLMCE